MKRKCQVKVSKKCLGLTEDWEKINGTVRCWNCGKEIREREALLLSKQSLDTCSNCGCKTDSIMQSKNGDLVCESCLESKDNEIEDEEF